MLTWKKRELLWRLMLAKAVMFPHVCYTLYLHWSRYSCRVASLIPLLLLTWKLVRTSVLFCWTGPLDWTTGLTFDAFCANLLIIHIVELSTFCVWSKYNGYKLQQCLHGALQSCKLACSWLEKSIFTLEMASVLYMLINNSWSTFSYLKQVQQIQTIPMPTVYEDCKPVHFTQFSLEDGYAK